MNLDLERRWAPCYESAWCSQPRSVLVGAVVYLWRHGSERVDYAVFRGEPANLRTLAGIVREAGSGHGQAIIQVGLLLLIATPIARVAFAGYLFARRRDMSYVVITLIVLGCLLASLFSGHL